VNLYLKFNDFDYDPLGEDPTTIERREHTRKLLSANGDLEGAVVKPSRQLEQLTHLYSRNALEVRQAKMWGRNPLPLGEQEFQILQSLNGGKEVSALGTDAQDHVRRLAEHGVVDLIPQG
jgi:hypothetical protein